MKIKSALILCGGKGSRLGSLSKKIAKSLIRINKKEILWYIIKVLKKKGFNQFVLPIGYKGNEIKKFLIKNKNFETNIKAIKTGINTSIGKRISLVIDQIKSDNFLLVNGDAIFDFDINKVIDEHEKNKSIITFMSTEITYQYGTVGVQNNKVVDFKRDISFESVKLRDNPLYNAFNYSGISIINTDVLKKLKKSFTNSNNFENEVYPKLIKKKRAMIKRIIGFWHSIDNIKDIKIIEKNKKKNSYLKRLKKNIINV